MSSDAFAQAPAGAKKVNLNEVTFDTSFLPQSSANQIDLKRFESSNAVPPGTYRSDIIVNQQLLGRSDLVFHDLPGSQETSTCLGRDFLTNTLNVDLEKAQREKAIATNRIALGSAGEKDCIESARIGEYIPGAQAEYNLSKQELVLSIPQAYQKGGAQGAIDPALWDDGVPVAMVNYDANTFYSKRDHESSEKGSRNSYIGLNAGINYGPWRLRHQSSIRWNEGQGRQSQTIGTYLQRALPGWQSQLSMGDFYTRGDVIDSFTFRGASLATDDRMLPNSLQGYAPIIRGIADTNAQVSIMQNGYLIYQTTVAPGPFEISDLATVGYTGDLEVIVEEADGRRKTFTIPFSAVPMLLRENYSRFEFAAGQLRDSSLNHLPNFFQGTYQYGISNNLTAYFSALAAEDYGSGVGGLAFNTPYGAFSVDLGFSRADLMEHGRRTGTSARVNYAKLVEATKTNLNVAAYRYTTRNYLSFTDAASLRDRILSGTYDPSLRQIDRRNRFQISVNQPLNDSQWGTLTFSANIQDYWDQSPRDTSYQAGYSKSFLWGNLNFNATRVRVEDNEYSNQYYLTLIFPLGSGAYAPTLSTSASYDDHRDETEYQATLSGTYGEKNQLSYSVFGSHMQAQDSSQNKTSGGVSGQYRGSQGSVSASYSKGNRFTQNSFGLAGSVVAHAGGVTLGQTMSETAGLVEADGAHGAGVTSTTNVSVDRFGYAIVPSLTPFRQNVVELDAANTSANVELKNTRKLVVPTSGAVSLLKYETESGRPILFKAKQDDGTPPPFGAYIENKDGQILGQVGQAGRAFIRAPEDSGSVIISWGEGGSKRCQIDYQLPPDEGAEFGYLQREVRCRHVPAIQPVPPQQL